MWVQASVNSRVLLLGQAYAAWSCAVPYAYLHLLLRWATFYMLFPHATPDAADGLLSSHELATFVYRSKVNFGTLAARRATGTDASPLDTLTRSQRRLHNRTGTAAPPRARYYQVRPVKGARAPPRRGPHVFTEGPEVSDRPRSLGRTSPSWFTAAVRKMEQQRGPE